MNVLGLTKGRTRTEHLVESVSFPPDTHPGECPIECTCGWVGLVREWPAHGKGLRVSYGRRSMDPAMPWLTIPNRAIGVPL